MMAIKQVEVKKMSDDDLKDIEELKKVLEVVGKEVPPLIGGILNSVLNKQNAEEYGKQVSEFYKELKNSGMSEENAVELTRRFMESRDPVSLVKKVLSESNIGGDIFSRKKWKDRTEKDEEEE